MASRGKQVSELAELVAARVIGDAATLVTAITDDSRTVRPGSLYFALRGSNVDGHDFVATAVRMGAAAVCVEHETSCGVTEMVVDDTRAVVGDLAAAFFDHPSHVMDVIGVTGTNGKTTVTHYIDSIGNQSGRVTGLVGTIHTRIAGEESPATMTTPEACEFQRLLADMRERGVSLAAAEISSHGLAFGRVRGTRFAVAAFTNLSQDHLDFHGDMVSYRAAKERLFTDYEVGTAVINIDDETGADIASGYRGELFTVGVGGDFTVEVMEPLPGRTRFSVASPWGVARVEAPVTGDFNVSNLVIAVACSVAAGIAFHDVVDALAGVAGVPGRFEVVSGDDPITVIVDYAHTPEGVTRAVTAGRRLTRRRVIGLLGAGGDRDRAKRPAMGAAISEADFAVVTSDNPRSEDPEEIVASVASGLRSDREHVIEVDRRRAIGIAIEAAEDGDIVLIMGRGHEPFQQIGEEKVPFDDRVVAREALLRRRGSSDPGPASGSISP